MSEPVEMRMSEEPGIRFEAKEKYGKEPVDPGRGKHLWTVMAVYQIADPAVSLDPNGQIIMDRENLISVVGPGCYKCEEPWTKDRARRFCQGVMT